MRNFTKKNTSELLMNQIDSKTLLLQYPEFKEIVLNEFSVITGESSALALTSILSSHDLQNKYYI